MPKAVRRALEQVARDVALSLLLDVKKPDALSDLVASKHTPAFIASSHASVHYPRALTPLTDLADGVVAVPAVKSTSP